MPWIVFFSSVVWLFCFSLLEVESSLAKQQPCHTFKRLKVFLFSCLSGLKNVHFFHSWAFYGAFLIVFVL